MINSGIDKTSLGYLGEDYQYKLVKEFMEDKSCFKDLAPIIDQNMFTAPNLRDYVGIMLDYYKKHNDVPSYTSMSVEMRQKAHTQVDIELADGIINKVRNTQSDGSEQTREMATKFFKQQNIIKAANEMLKLAGSGELDNYDKCEELLKNALNTGNHEDYEESRLFDGIDETLSNDARTVIPTGIGKIDETLNGGIGKGELGVIVGPSGYGKCLSVNELLATPNGVVKMGDIKVGDKVFGTDGKAHNVTGVYPQGKRDIYKVTFSNGSSVLCDMEHLWTFIVEGKAQTKTLKEWVGDDRILTLPEVNWIHVNRDVFVSDYKDSNLSTSEIDYPSETISLKPIGHYITFKSYEFYANEDAQCISVDSEDHLYLTGSLIPTHNTTVTTSMALTAAGFKSQQNNNQGFKVMQIVFEDRIKQIQRKHFSKITQVEACNLSKNEYEAHVKDILSHYENREMIQENLRIIRLKSGEKSIDWIVDLIKKHIDQGFRPDLVIIDYFECIKLTGPSQMAKWDKESGIMRKIEAAANDLNIAFWVPVQGNRDSINAELVTMDNAGGSLGKIQIAHIIMSITRSLEDIAENIATISILKNRAGSSGKVISGAVFNNGTCTISTDNVQEFDSGIAFDKHREQVEEEDKMDLLKQVHQSAQNRKK